MYVYQIRQVAPVNLTQALQPTTYTNKDCVLLWNVLHQKKNNNKINSRNVAGEARQPDLTTLSPQTIPTREAHVQVLFKAEDKKSLPKMIQCSEKKKR